jgi:hypothetical protein
MLKKTDNCYYFIEKQVSQLLQLVKLFEIPAVELEDK